MRKTIRIAIEDEAHKQAKIGAAQSGITLAAWIEAAINEKLNRDQKKGGKKAA